MYVYVCVLLYPHMYDYANIHLYACIHTHVNKLSYTQAATVNFFYSYIKNAPSDAFRRRLNLIFLACAKVCVHVVCACSV